MIKKVIYLIISILITYISFQFFTTNNETIDRIFVINLDRSNERYSLMNSKLKSLNLGIKHERISAVDGREVEFINLNTQEALTGADILDNQIILKGYYKIICSKEEPGDEIFVRLDWSKFHMRGVGEMGHTCSSRKTWKKIIDKEYKNTLILEDDLIFSNDFSSYLKRNMGFAPKDYDLLYLNLWDHWSSYTYKRKIDNSFLRFSLNIYDQYIRNLYWKKVRRNIVSAKSYIVTQAAAKKLLEYTQRMPDNILVTDVSISFFIEDEKLIAYNSKLRLVDNNEDLKSDVDALFKKKNN